MRDDDRPPVMAHQRFVADRTSFADMDLAQRFRHIHDTNLWGAAASVSGLGSETDATAVLRAELPRLLGKLQVTSLLDAPCGDAGWITQANSSVRIIGIDIVPPLIDSLKRRVATGEIGGEYHLADITRDPLPRCDAILCRDCLVHLSFANIERALANFRRSGAIWLITTTFTQWQTNRECEDGDWRALNFERPPFNWGAPVELIDEHCTEAGGGWRDKSLGAWRLADLAAVVPDLIRDPTPGIRDCRRHLPHRGKRSDTAYGSQIKSGTAPEMAPWPRISSCSTRHQQQPCRPRSHPSAPDRPRGSSRA